MNTQLIIAILLTALPLIELRAGMPVAVDYALKTNSSLVLVFFAIVFLNILIVFPILLFLDFFHERLCKISFYRRFSDFFIRRARKKALKIEKKMGLWSYLALAMFVAVPLPGTGAWTGTLIAWILKMNRLRSILAIALGVFIAGIIVFLASIGIIGFLV